MRPLLDELHAAIFEVTGHPPAAGDWAQTPNRVLGDIAYPCFKIAKERKQTPAAAATELAPLIKAKLKKGSLIKDIVPSGPYLNVFFAALPLHRWLLDQLKGDRVRLGSSTVGSGKTVVLDFSSPNTAKEIGLHHLRSTAIGHALANIAELHGYRAVRINYLGDWGTSHGKNIMALKMFSSEAEVEAKGLPFILDLYVRFNAAEKAEKLENKTTLAESAKAAFKRLEDGDPECRRIWAMERAISVAEAEKLYARMRIRFDHYDGESLYERKLDAVVDEVTAKIGTRHSEGALVCDLPGQKLPVLLKKDDGASLYMTRDIAAAEDRFERFHFDLAWYVVAIQQKLHFTQLFTVLKLLGKGYADRCEHLAFGMLSFGAKTMKSREGNILFLGDVLDEAKKRALEIIREKNPALPNADATAEMIGTGAILFADLSQNRTRDLSFEWEKALSFEGDTAPFIQYTHARCNSLIKKVMAHLGSLKAEEPMVGLEGVGRLLEHDPSVRQLLGDMAYFQTYSERAFFERDPSQIATATLDVAKSFNQLYHKIRFLDETSTARLRVLLQLTDGTRALLAHGLAILGIQAPAEM